MVFHETLKMIAIKKYTILVVCVYQKAIVGETIIKQEIRKPFMSINCLFFYFDEKKTQQFSLQ